MEAVAEIGRGCNEAQIYLNKAGFPDILLQSIDKEVWEQNHFLLSFQRPTIVIMMHTLHHITSMIDPSGMGLSKKQHILSTLNQLKGGKYSKWDMLLALSGRQLENTRARIAGNVASKGSTAENGVPGAK